MFYIFFSGSDKKFIKFVLYGIYISICLGLGFKYRSMLLSRCLEEIGIVINFFGIKGLYDGKLYKKNVLVDYKIVQVEDNIKEEYCDVRCCKSKIIKYKI